MPSQLSPSNDNRVVTGKPPVVALFVTCLVDAMRPSIGFAAAKLITDSGCRVVLPRGITCCGQPAYNSGEKADAAEIARLTIKALEGYDYVVVPSGSCGGMLKAHYPELFAADDPWRNRADIIAERTFELMQFLVDVRGMTAVKAACHQTATYHDSCSGLRELGIKSAPRKLLATVEGLKLVEMNEAETCCGFGGTFAIKYPAVSGAITEKKTANVAASGAQLLLAGDLGCLMNMAGKISREGRKIEVRHVAEVLAGMTDDLPPIGERPPIGKRK